MSTQKSYPLLFEPVFKERIWGGSELQNWFEQCPQGEKIGEAWVVSDHPEGETRIANGHYAGFALHELMTKEPTWFAGITSDRRGRFPLLFKVIDAADDLSVQVHPDDIYGYKHAGEQGKTECWWVLGADEKAKIIYGHTAKSRSEFEQHVESGAWDNLLQAVHPSVGDFYFVPSGKLHALGKGTMVLEVQQSSDTTYRVYDYDRRDANGNPRALHIADALEVTQYPDMPVPSQRRMLKQDGTSEKEHLVTCPYFRVEHWRIHGNLRQENPELSVLSVIAGDGQLTAGDTSVALRKGSQILLPAGLGTCEIDGSVEIIVTTMPTTA